MMGFFRFSTRIVAWGKGWAIALGVTVLLVSTACTSASPSPVAPLPQPPQIETGVPDRLTEPDLPDLKEALPETTAIEEMPSPGETSGTDAPALTEPEAIADPPQDTVADPGTGTPTPDPEPQPDAKAPEQPQPSAAPNQPQPSASIKPDLAQETGASPTPQTTSGGEAVAPAEAATVPSPTAAAQPSSPSPDLATAAASTTIADEVKAGASPAPPALVQPDDPEDAADTAMQALEASLLGTATAEDSPSVPSDG